ncbi:MAG TPA: TolC family protein [Kofleriaceae bacterium]|nr:TolC family protein [Kofleriaceae bacterium]
MFALALCSATWSRALAPPQQEVLTLEKALEIAERVQPTLALARANVQAARGRVDQVGVTNRPQATLSASAAVGSSPVRPCIDDARQSCGGFFDPTMSTGLGAQASWRIYDFGQTSLAIRAARLSAEAAELSVSAELLDVRNSVEIAYLEAVARQRLIAVAESTVRSEETHLDQARKFVAAQAKDPIEVVQAQARAANARSALAQAQSAQAIALANLRAAIGWLDASRSPVVAGNWPTPPANDPVQLGALVEEARKNRSEIRQFDRQIAAAEASYDAAYAQRRPVLSAIASTQWGPNENDWAPEPSWNAGITLSWQLLDGGRARADQRVARANVVSAKAQRDALLVSLTSQIELARAQIVANRANVEASSEAVKAAREQLKLADARYTQGLGSQIELADAQTAVTTAEGNLVQAEWQLAEAWAQLRRALGVR